MEILLFIIIFLLGISIGSFLNVCIDRLPAKKSLVSPPSHCDSCQCRLSPGDLIPVFSYLWLRGRCRYCGSSIPLRSLIIEILTGLLFALFLWRYSLGAEFAAGIFFCSIFIVIMFIDLDHRLILNRVTYPAAVAALIISIFQPQEVLFSGLPGVVDHILAGLLGFTFFLTVALIKPGGMGWGDVKLAGLIGLVTGLRMVMLALFIGIFLGGTIVIALLLLKIKGRKDAIPFGPFLVLGPIIALLWGQGMVDWYLNHF